MHLLALLQRAAVQSRQEAAAHRAVHRTPIGHWLTAYESGGLEALLTIDAPGARPEPRMLSPDVLERLQMRHARDGFSSYGEVVSGLAQEHGGVVPYPTLHKLVRYRRGAKLKRARPVHAKKLVRLPPYSPAGIAGLVEVRRKVGMAQVLEQAPDLGLHHPRA